LSAATACDYLCSVRPFVAGRARQDGLDLAGVTASDVNRFVLDACQHRATGSAKLIVTALRSLLNFLHLSDEMAESLTSAVARSRAGCFRGYPKGSGPMSCALFWLVVTDAGRPGAATTRSC
jgi:integrase/recombinase XerD